MAIQAADFPCSPSSTWWVEVFSEKIPILDQTKMQRKARTKSQKWYPSTNAEHNGFGKIRQRPSLLRLPLASLLNVKSIQTKLSFAVAPTLSIRWFLLHCYVHNFPNSWWTLTLVHLRLPILNFFTSSATRCQIYSLKKPRGIMCSLISCANMAFQTSPRHS